MSLFKSTKTLRGSHIWKSLFNGIQWLWYGMKCIVGDGQTIRVWDDHWLPGGALRSCIEGPLMQNDKNNWVSSLRANHNWTFHSLHVPLPPQLEQLILGIPVARVARLFDTFVWPHNNRTSSVSSASKFLYQQKHVSLDKQLWNWIWKLQCSKKIQFFLWKGMHKRLPTKQYLAFSRPHINNLCPRCNSPETTIHILHDCP